MAKSSKKKKKKTGGVRLYLMLVFLAVVCAVFLSTSLILFIGLIPSLVAFFVDQSEKKMKAVTVGSFNAIGCIPFVMQLWDQGKSLEVAMQIIFDPMVLVIIYSAAAVGYLVDWMVVSVATALLYKKGQDRKEAIAKRQAQLIKRWGDGVKGE